MGSNFANKDVSAQMPVITDVRPASQASVALEREELFPIREVSRVTGFTPVTLRAVSYTHLTLPTIYSV